MTRRGKAKASELEEQTVAPGTEMEAEPTVEEERRELARKLAIFASNWRRCPRAQCRRARACRLPDLTCFSTRPRSPMTPEEESRVMGELKRALERRLAEFRP